MKNHLLISSILLFSLFSLAVGCKTIKPNTIANQEREPAPPPAEIVQNTRGQADQSPVQRRQPNVNNTIPFTQSIRNKIEAAPNGDIMRVQYFISKDIKLRRTDGVESLEITEEGTVVMRDGKEEKEYIITSNLKGTCVSQTENSVRVTFSDSEDRFLTFESSPTDNGIYHLVAEWDEKGYGNIQYGDQDFIILPGSKGAQLLFSVERVSENKSKQVKEKGRDINNNNHN